MLALRPKALFCAHAGPVAEPHRALGAKRDFLLRAREEAGRLRRQGLSPKEVRDRLLGGKPLAYLSFGEMSRLRFVQALLEEA